MTEVLAAAQVYQPETYDDRRPGGSRSTTAWSSTSGTATVRPGSTDLGSVLLTAGYVDIQVNGIGPDDFATADPDGWRRAGRRAARRRGHVVPADARLGARSTPTTARSTASRPRATTPRPRDLPRIEGVHLEGPFLGGAPGAHPPELLRRDRRRLALGLLDRHPGLVRLVTLAPEADPGFEGDPAARDARRRGRARPLDAAPTRPRVAAADAGARLVTHLFNGMGPRAPPRTRDSPAPRSTRRADPDTDRRPRARAPDGRRHRARGARRPGDVGADPRDRCRRDRGRVLR